MYLRAMFLSLSAIFSSTHGWAAYHCPELATLRNTEQDAAPTLQQCINQVPSGDALELPAGNYTVSSTINFARPILISTKGLAPQSAPCGYNGTHSCAELRANTTLIGPLVLASGGDITFDHIVINGRRELRTTAVTECQQNRTYAGYNMAWRSCARCQMLASVSTKALCGTALEIDTGSSPVAIRNSAFVDNGRHNASMLWSDGLTVHDAFDADVVQNYFRNNTDIDLIFGGCRNCRIIGNRVEHTGEFAGAAFAAVMIQAWPTSSGDYTGTPIERNVVDCGMGRGCGMAYLLGSSPWYAAPSVRGFDFRDNLAVNGQAGFVVANDVEDARIGDNDADPNTGHVICRTSGGERAMHAFAVGPHAKAQFVGTRVGRNMYVLEDYSRAIPNYFEGCRPLH